MASDQSDKLDDVADGLDELKTTTEDLADNPPAHASQTKIEKLGDAIETARDIADDLEDDTR
jgi:methyl-accepting chemotaxis protein